jgi:hypothetical protein
VAENRRSAGGWPLGARGATTADATCDRAVLVVDDARFRVRARQRDLPAVLLTATHDVAAFGDPSLGYQRSGPTRAISRVGGVG